MNDYYSERHGDCIRMRAISNSDSGDEYDREREAAVSVERGVPTEVVGWATAGLFVIISLVCIILLKEATVLTNVNEIPETVPPTQLVTNYSLTFDFPPSLQYGDEYHGSSIITFKLSGKYHTRIYLNSGVLSLTKFYFIKNSKHVIPEGVYRLSKRWWEFTFDSYLPEVFDFHIYWTAVVSVPMFEISGSSRTRSLFAQGGPELFPCVAQTEAFFGIRIRTTSDVAVITPDMPFVKLLPISAGFILIRGSKIKQTIQASNQSVSIYSDNDNNNKKSELGEIVNLVTDAQIKLSKPKNPIIQNWKFFLTTATDDLLQHYVTLTAVPIIQPFSQMLTLSISIKQILLVLNYPLHLVDFGSKYLSAEILNYQNGYTSNVLSYYACQQKESLHRFSLSIVNWMYQSSESTYGSMNIKKYSDASINNQVPVVIVSNNTLRVRDGEWRGIRIPAMILFSNKSSLFVTITTEITIFDNTIISCNHMRRFAVDCEYDREPNLSSLSCIDKSGFLSEGYSQSLFVGLKRSEITFKKKCLMWYHAQAVQLNELFFLTSKSTLESHDLVMNTTADAINNWFSEQFPTYSEFSEVVELTTETEIMMCQNVFFYNISTRVRNQAALQSSCSELFSYLELYKKATLDPTLLSETIPALDVSGTLSYAIKVLAVMSPSLLKEFQFLIFPKWDDVNFVLTMVASSLPVNHPVTDYFVTLYPSYLPRIQSRRDSWRELYGDLSPP